MTKTCDTNWEQYDYRLTRNTSAKRKESIASAAKSFTQLALTNPGYQPVAKRNGETQPMIATRTKNICNLSVFPQDDLFAGDLIECYNETWLVIESYRDEYGLVTGTSWLCNYELVFQASDGRIIKTKCVIDDGSYSTTTQKDITTSNAQYTMYLPLNDDTKKIYIDKRFAVGKMYNQFGEEILQVMKVTWIDTFDQQQSTNGHLLKIRITDDLYNKEKDNISLMICDYLSDETPEDKPEEMEPLPEVSNYKFEITGRDSLRIGTSRTYEYSITDTANDTVNDTVNETEVVWSIDNSDCSIDVVDKTCKVSIPLDDSLIGTEITLSISSVDGSIPTCNKVIKVVTIG